MDGFIVSVNDDLLLGAVFECDEQTPCSSYCFNGFLVSINHTQLKLRRQLFDANKNCEKLTGEVNDETNCHSFLKQLVEILTVLQQFNELSNRRLALYEWAQMVDPNARDVWINAQTTEKEHQRVTKQLLEQQAERYTEMINFYGTLELSYEKQKV